jgi:hypothetical protein
MGQRREAVGWWRGMSKKVTWVKTGIVRCPNVGEWFIGYRGYPVQAMFDFECQKFEIMEMRVEEAAML